jgi:hypothetical protein
MRSLLCFWWHRGVDPRSLYSHLGTSFRKSDIGELFKNLGGLNANILQIFARYTMGWWPTKLCVLLNLVILLGYSMIDAVVAGEMLSAVSPAGSLTVAVGIIVVAIITWVVTTFGITVFHYYER